MAPSLPASSVPLSCQLTTSGTQQGGAGNEINIQNDCKREEIGGQKYMTVGKGTICAQACLCMVLYYIWPFIISACKIKIQTTITVVYCCNDGCGAVKEVSKVAQPKNE